MNPTLRLIAGVILCVLSPILWIGAYRWWQRRLPYAPLVIGYAVMMTADGIAELSSRSHPEWQPFLSISASLGIVIPVVVWLFQWVVQRARNPGDGTTRLPDSS